jgi:hypothetical protein
VATERSRQSDQFYVTHCSTADSVLNKAGYSVRAASATEPADLTDALAYPPYELPATLRDRLPAASAAPRRLARTRHPRGGLWVAHTAYLPKDSAGGDRSYFSHILRLPTADPAAVLRSWGASGWATDYPAGATRLLPRSPRVPLGSWVGDENLTAFLGSDPPGASELAVAICPFRLRGTVATRREQFARLVVAVLCLTEPGDRRLFVHVEPGVLALLLYGAIRVLPPERVADLTFSTYEPFHRLTDDKPARVVGTYLGAGETGPVAELGAGADLVLDTFDLGRSSPALCRPLDEALPGALRELLDLAAAGDWASLEDVHRWGGRS